MTDVDAVATGTPGSQADDDQGGTWSRMHWATPYLRSWSAFVIGGFLLVQNVGEDAVRSLFSGERPETPSLSLRVLAWVAAGVGAALVLAASLGVVSWRATRFRVGARAVELRQGVVFRTQKSARLDRIQAVDVVRPLLARLVGLAALRIEVAGGGDSKLVLQFLRVPAAVQLRDVIIAGATGAAPPPERPRPPTPVADGVPGPSAGAAPEAGPVPVPAPLLAAAPPPALVEVPVPRLVGSLALTGSLVALVVTVTGLIVTMIVLETPLPFTVVVATALGWVGSLWKRFTRGYGFRLGVVDSGLQLRHGLLDLKTQTVPTGRVQAVRVSQPFLWRRPDWWLLEVNVAGYGPALGEEAQTVLLPVGTRAQAHAVLGLVVGDLGEGERAAGILEAAFTGVDPGPGFTVAPRRVRRLDPWGYRRIGVFVAADALVVRRGRFGRHVEVVPHARTQSLGLAQGPLQRRLRVATVQLHSTPGPIMPQVAHLDVDDAAALLQAQAVRDRLARGGRVTIAVDREPPAPAT